MDGASIPDPAKNFRGRRAGAEKVASGLRHQREKALHHSAVWISKRIEHGEVIGIGDLLVPGRNTSLCPRPGPKLGCRTVRHDQPIPIMLDFVHPTRA